jgi:hypothetical protein
MYRNLLEQELKKLREQALPQTTPEEHVIVNR